jgi:hypothetical protein
MKISAFPLKIQLECVSPSGEWELMLTYHVNSPQMLYKKIEEIKSMYVLKREYRIFLIVNSKVNTYLEK